IRDEIGKRADVTHGTSPFSVNRHLHGAEGLAIKAASLGSEEMMMESRPAVKTFLEFFSDQKVCFAHFFPS
ncbi:MAG: hypothetical protein ABUT39_05330, partial [Acidobacteriota bacterium]